MARRIAYTGDAPVTLADFAQWVRDDFADVQTHLVENIIIPGVIAQCEEITGAAIRPATYEEDWHPNRGSNALDVGQARTLTRVQRLSALGEDLPLKQFPLSIGDRISLVLLPTSFARESLRMTYNAALDWDAHPSVRTWLLMQAASLYGTRETWTIGQQALPLPSAFLNTLISGITVPPRF